MKAQVVLTLGMLLGGAAHADEQAIQAKCREALMLVREELQSVRAQVARLENMESLLLPLANEAQEPANPEPAPELTKINPPAESPAMGIALKDLPFGKRARNAFKALRIKTVRDLVTKQDADSLLAQNSFGPQALTDTRKVLASVGVTLRGDEDYLENAAQTPLSEISFSRFARRLLNNLDAETLADLAEYSEADLRETPGGSDNNIEELRSLLATAGLAFAGDPPLHESYASR